MTQRNLKTLEERLAKRNHRELCSLPPHIHVRAELDRLARQVRKLSSQYSKTIATTRDWNEAIGKVLNLIREAKK